MKAPLLTSMKSFLRSFDTKVTLLLILTLLIITGIDSFLLYKFDMDNQLKHLREKQILLARNAALIVDAETIRQIPLEHSGTSSPAYKATRTELNKIKLGNPEVRKIYILGKTDSDNALQVILDPERYPGDRVDTTRIPAALQAFEKPVAHTESAAKDTNAIFSGFAPIHDINGKTIAIVGVDLDASGLAQLRMKIKMRTLLILFIYFLVSVGLGIVISQRITGSINKLVVATRRISEGDLSYRVELDAEEEMVSLATSFNDMAESLLETRKEMHNYFYRVVQTLVRTIEAKDTYTRGHSDRVALLAEQIAVKMGFSTEEAEALKEASLLHDIGKLGISDSILQKKEALNKEEWDIIHEHPLIGEEILKPVLRNGDMLSVVRSHHERFDGSGYPDKKSGDNINIFAQIVSVADCFDAMTSKRAYRDPLSRETAIQTLKDNSGTQFNPKVVETFLEMIKEGQIP
jgi:putative nucleotidyltransferase with HDIG domain